MGIYLCSSEVVSMAGGSNGHNRARGERDHPEGRIADGSLVPQRMTRAKPRFASMSHRTRIVPQSLMPGIRCTEMKGVAGRPKSVAGLHPRGHASGLPNWEYAVQGANQARAGGGAAASPMRIRTGNKRIAREGHHRMRRRRFSGGMRGQALGVIRHAHRLRRLTLA